MNCVYQVTGNDVLTNACAAGPWDPTMQHGGAPASLVVWAAERIPTRDPMQVARLTIDLLRPVPVAPLQIQSKVVREGRKIQLCEVTLLAQGIEVARGSVLKIRCADAPLPPHVADEPLDVPGPEHGDVPEGLVGEETNAFISGLALRTVKGAFHQIGPAAIWFRAQRAIVAGAPISPAMRAAMTGDFCNGVSSILDFRRWTFINADLTVSLARQPVGEWILLDARSWLGNRGCGIAFARLGDAQGYFGRAVQSMVIEERVQGKDA